MNYFVCTYGNFPERDLIFRESLKDGKYILHCGARYPSALGHITKGDVLLLSLNHLIVAYGVAKDCVRRIPEEEWCYRVDVEEWKSYDSAKQTNGVSSYGVFRATLIGGAMSTVRKVKADWAVEKMFYMDRLKELPIMERNCFELSIADIASWTYSELQSDVGIVARIPVLQRGLVWKPQQNELLWDSLFRRIPIGALILCPTVMNQSRGVPCTHHILDGQQRCNAIGIGFDDEPFNDKAGIPNKSILWMDLNPEAKNLERTSRHYLFRMTTPAHPWGYQVSDAVGREACLSVPEIREAQKHACSSCRISEMKKRPYTSEMYPYFATVPIPVGYLTRSYLQLDDKEDEETFWRLVGERCEGLKSSFADLYKRLMDFLGDGQEKLVRQRAYVFKGLRMSFEEVIVAMNAPSEIVEESESNEGQSAIEHLFTRINRQGTPLDGEELVYSSIKAYWPEIAESIDKCSEGRMVASKMLMLALRLVETEESNSHFSWSVSVSQVRRFASDEKKKASALQLIENELDGLCAIVDKWLLHRDGVGFPKVLKTSIANNASELYLLLLVLAKKNPNLDRTFVVKLSVLLYFCAYRVRKSYRPDIVKHILEVCYNKGFEEDVIRASIHECMSVEKRFLRMTDLSHLDVEKNLTEVSFKIDDLKDGLTWWDCFSRFRCSRELLLFAEAPYLEEEFPDYDPARKDLWAEYNRPWDFDHVVAQKTVNGWPEAKENSWWLWCIGNLAAIPLEENRSKSDGNDWHYYDGLKKTYPDCFDVGSFERICTASPVDLVDFRKAVWKRFLILFSHLWGMVGEFFENDDQNRQK